MAEQNYYDEISVDIAALHESDMHGRWHVPCASLYLTGALVKLGWYKRLVDAGMVRGWFDEFHRYWIDVIKGRPLNFHDFFFLYANYRKKFQEVSVDEERDVFIKAWQMPQNIYLVFASAYKYGLSPLGFYPFRKYLRRARNVLEYGCGISPVTYSAVKFMRGCSGKNFTIADIPGFTFHFAKWRLSTQRNVTAFTIDPEQAPELGRTYDLVFLLTVLEHLPNPLEVLQNITSHIEKGGYLIFDFVLGDGGGLDTRAAVEARSAVLDFIRSHYSIESGELKVDRSMGTTIVRKK